MLQIAFSGGISAVEVVLRGDWADASPKGANKEKAMIIADALFICSLLIPLILSFLSDAHCFLIARVEAVHAGYLSKSDKAIRS